MIEEANGVVRNEDGTLDFEGMDQEKLASLAISVIQDKIEKISVLRDYSDFVESATLWQLLKTRPFLEIYTMSLFSVLIGLFIIGSSKAYGESTIKNE